MEEDKVRGYCRICKYLRQTKHGVLYCIKDRDKTLVNFDCKDFELDGIIKEYINEWQKHKILEV